MTINTGMYKKSSGNKIVKTLRKARVFSFLAGEFYSSTHHIYMKAILFFLLAACSSWSGNAQTKGTLKLYGFTQAVSGGKAPEMDPNTGLRVSGGAGKNYFLYAVSPARIYPSEIWIEGTRFGVDIQSVKETPVEYSEPGNIGAPSKVLIPKTTQKVIQLLPGRAVEVKGTSKKAGSLAKTNELVVVYKQNGKFYYQTLSKLIDLQAAAM